MAILSKTERDDLAKIIDRLVIASQVKDDALKDRDMETFTRSFDTVKKLADRLHDQYGIELHAYVLFKKTEAA